MTSFKNIIKSALLFAFLSGVTGCADMLESDSSRQNFEPEINSKTDSVFYAYGIFEAMQQLADQYVFQGEMRGDLVKTTYYTDNNLRQLANFTATAENKYDSAYVYYRVINNCNYYLAHRATDLYTGSENVVMTEYAAIKAIRAWAYLQLGRNYQRAKFFTEPLTEISQIDDNQFPELDLAGIVGQLAADLEKYTGYPVPTYGTPGGFNVGSPNWENTQKSVVPRNCFIPVDVVLGDMYLEVGQYDAAAKHFITYLTKVATSTSSPYIAPMASKTQGSGRFGGMIADGLPENSQIAARVETTPAWSNIFARNSTTDLISYIPMAVNKQQGRTTLVPLAFGFNYYATSEENQRLGNLRDPFVENIQIKPSDALNLLSDSTEFYYYSVGGQNNYDSIRISKAGDMRMRSIIQQATVNDTTMQWITKYKYANVILYRTSTVLLHLAEAFNRLGMYDAAFAILKDGISENLLLGETGPDYISAETLEKLKTTYPLLSDLYIERFPAASACGIHCHGAGRAAGDCALTNYQRGSSPYTMGRMTGLKLAELAEKFTLPVGTTKQDSINAIEDMLCDEYALEFAFEGNRYFDLLRLARHKNGHAGTDSSFDGSPASYGANFGGRWLSKKLEYKSPAVNLEDENNWYLPFQ